MYTHLVIQIIEPRPRLFDLIYIMTIHLILAKKRSSLKLVTASKTCSEHVPARSDLFLVLKARLYEKKIAASKFEIGIWVLFCFFSWLSSFYNFRKCSDAQQNDTECNFSLYSREKQKSFQRTHHIQQLYSRFNFKRSSSLKSIRWPITSMKSEILVTIVGSVPFWNAVLL